MFVMKRFLTLIFSLCAAGMLATDIYVSPNGSDRNPGTEKAPLQKVQSALNRVKPGDTIKLLPGVYREENLTISRSGSADKVIRIEGLRDRNGQYLAVLEPAGKVLKNWQKAPEIGENIWKTPLAKRPDLVMLDGAMIALVQEHGIFGKQPKCLFIDQYKKILTYSRGNLVFVLNFNPSESLSDYWVTVPSSGQYEVVFSTDDKAFGGWDRIDHEQICRAHKHPDGSPKLQIYLPARTGLCLKKVKSRK
jgi:hypothetical protein